MPDLSAFETHARAALDARNDAREIALSVSRKVIRHSANTIRSLHRGEFEAADGLLANAGELHRELREAVADHPDLQFAGFTSDAGKEYAEATLTACLIKETPLTGAEELGVDVVPWLHGLGEAVGELRRRLLDTLRGGDLAEAERLLDEMNQIVDLLASLDYPDGMTSGLRRTTDVARALVERSRSDLTATAVQERLRADLAKHLEEIT